MLATYAIHVEIKNYVYVTNTNCTFIIYCTLSVMINHHAFTLIELLVVVAIIAVLAGLLIPSIRTVREIARTVTCQNKMRQIALGQIVYAQDNRGTLPPICSARAGSSDGTGSSWTGQVWDDRLVEGGYVEVVQRNDAVSNDVWIKGEMFRCPTDTMCRIGGSLPGLNHNDGYSPRSYVGNGHVWWDGAKPVIDTGRPMGNRVAVIQSPSQTVLLAEAWYEWAVYSWHPCAGLPYDWATTWNHRFGKVQNMAFVDGHVKAIDSSLRVWEEYSAQQTAPYANAATNKHLMADGRY